MLNTSAMKRGFYLTTTATTIFQHSESTRDNNATTHHVRRNSRMKKKGGRIYAARNGEKNELSSFSSRIIGQLSFLTAGGFQFPLFPKMRVDTKRTRHPLARKILGCTRVVELCSLV